MIPIQVRMRGWMRYRDEEAADFSSGNLISICGDNGGGKSSIFDAITFALFGKHRLGQHLTDELISQGEDSTWVEFDFEIEGVRWRVHRGRSRGSTSRTGAGKAGVTTHALYRFDAASGTWLQIPNTDSPANLQRALDGILGMSEPTFTSSFLLQQGAATQFLDARPADRFKIISSLIGLEAYEQLAKLASESARRERQRVQDIAKSIADLGDVSKELVSAQQEAWRQAQSEAKARQAALVTAQTRAGDAARFAERSSQIEALSLQIQEADLLLGRRAQIEDDASTYESLTAYLETVSRLQQELEAAKGLGGGAEVARAEAQAIDIEVLTLTLDGSRRVADEAEAAAEATARFRVAAEADERAMRDFLVVAETVTAARARLTEKLADATGLRLQLAGLESAKAEAALLAQLARAVQPLSTYESSLRKVVQLEEAAPAAALAQLVARAEALQTDIAAGAAKRAEYEEAWHLARTAAGAARAKAENVAAQLQQREEAAGELVCSRCGQPVTEEHRKAEIADLEAEVKAERELAQRRSAQEEDARKAHATAIATVDQLKDEVNARRTSIEGLKRDVDSLVEARNEVARSFQAFATAAPADLRSRVAGRTAQEVSAVLPSLSDISLRESDAVKRYQALLGVEGQLAAVEREIEAAETSQKRAEEEAGNRLAKLDGAAPAHQAAAAHLDQAIKEQEGAEALLVSSRAAAAAAAGALEAGVQRRLKLEGLALQKDAEARGRMSAVSAYSESLPEAMRSSVLLDPAAMVLELQAAHARLASAPQELTNLRQAEQRRAGWEGERYSKKAEIASIPEAHRVSVEEAQAGLSQAALANLEAMESLQEAAAELARLEERFERRGGLETQRETAANRQRLFGKLNRLLGKSGVQGALVTSALDSIKNHANAFLQHLTGGSLILELHKGTGADELDLRAVDTTCMREARSVLALSGSQKFRCAVAVAMGIGQYAGGRMRSIVIDEGFGSLDEIGQQQMVGELKNLADNMDKVIVVSHLDVFRDRDHFPYQLHVEKSGTSSHVSLAV